MESQSKVVWNKVEDFSQVEKIFDGRMLAKIAKEIETSLIRFGINVKMILELSKDRYGVPYVKADSSSFNTFPVLFKEIKIQGSFDIMELEGREDGKRIFKILCSLNYRWYHFRGGENGDTVGYTEIVYHQTEDGEGHVSSGNFSFNY